MVVTGNRDGAVDVRPDMPPLILLPTPSRRAKLALRALLLLLIPALLCAVLALLVAGDLSEAIASAGRALLGDGGTLGPTA